MAKFCTKCGGESPDTAVYCVHCGNVLGAAVPRQGIAHQGTSQGVARSAAPQGAIPQAASRGVAPQSAMPQGAARSVASPGMASQGMPKKDPGVSRNLEASTEISQLFVDSREKLRGIMQNTMAESFVTGEGFGKKMLFFTNRRFYAKTGRFSILTGLWSSLFVVDLEDISATEKIYQNPIQWLILAVFMLLFSFAGVASGAWPALFVGLLFVALFVVKYFLSRGTYIRVSYAGGSVLLSVKMYTSVAVTQFMNQLRVEMDQKK